MTQQPCRVYWGSHGCDLPRGHAGEHLCGLYDPSGPCGTPTRWFQPDDGGTDGGDLGDWTPVELPWELYGDDAPVRVIHELDLNGAYITFTTRGPSPVLVVVDEQHGQP